MICVFMAILFVSSRYIIRRPLKIGEKAVNFEAEGMEVFLLITGKVLDTLFKMMACQSVGDQSVHFYFGYETCYQWTWIVAVIVLLLFILSFAAVFVFARKLPVAQRQ